MSENLLKGLNTPQQEAVKNTSGANLVVAGAGSGKTRVLTFKIAYLIAKGVTPYRILALTFTNKAAREMRERISKLIGNEFASMLQMGTFHSIFAKMLRSDAEYLGYTSNFTIYDTSDSKSVIRKVIKDLKLNKDYYKDGQVYGRISKAKNNLITWQAYKDNIDLRKYDNSVNMPELYRIYAEYSKRCKTANAMDFDDLLLNINILFRDFPDILKKYQNRFDFILVDEYQDTNMSQYIIVKRLAEKHKNITVVGDDAQSIYSFRGAKIENILNFKNDYPDYKTYKLEQNYRSTKNIVNAANSIIKKNINQIQKNVFSDEDEGEKITVLKSNTDKEEGQVVIERIFDLQYQNQYKYSDFAILYRTNMQSRLFEESLRKRNIPYRIYGGTSFYQRKEVKDLLSYLRLVINPNDTEALKRIINYPRRGIGASTVEKLETTSADTGKSVWNILLHLSEINIGLNNGVINKLNQFTSFIISLIQEKDKLNAHEITHKIASESGILKDLYKDKTPEGVNRHDNIKELINAAKEFVEQVELEAQDEAPNLEAFIENVSLLTDLDSEDKDKTERVSLMTVHSAKGLEFKNVFIVGVEQDLFPSGMSSSTQQEIEEERRLFYVALTRAEENAFISYATARRKWGKFAFCSPSMFIGEIDQEFLNIPEEKLNLHFDNDNNDNFGTNKSYFDKTEQNISFKPKQKQEISFKPKPKSSFSRFNTKKSDSFSNFAADNYKDIKIGDKVEHARFGIGEILNIEGTSPDEKATVDFKMAGQKQLLLKFAKLKIIKS